MKNKNNFLENPEEIKSWLEKYNIKNYTLRQEPKFDESQDLVSGSSSVKAVWVVDVQGTVNLAAKKLEFIPVRFGTVVGNFYCNNNSLTNLLGCPKEVSGRFSCERNQLTSLEGVPEKIGEAFNCSENKLKYLDFFPKEVGDSCDIEHNDMLTSLPYGLCTFEEVQEEHIKHKVHLEKDMLTQELQPSHKSTLSSKLRSTQNEQTKMVLKI